ncbi:unnamed protein product [Coffea canephora]|uniref:Uncharacterized protein n=1 Tax=Coffea canephora TaxID=49390 RepID=A0A068U728_COFCA|nr:unnamed protein product [Coffea canephora]
MNQNLLSFICQSAEQVFSVLFSLHLLGIIINPTIYGEIPKAKLCIFLIFSFYFSG